MADEEFDRLAVQRDAALVHALATRTAPPIDIDLSDPVVTYLGSWVDWVDEGVDADEVFVLGQHKDRVAAKRGNRHRAALIAGSTMAALVVTSGAAAAVTGDPFIVAKAPLSVIEKINPFDGDSSAGERLPDKAPEVARVNALLAEAQRAMARGDTAEAERLMDEATAALGGGGNPGQQTRIDKLAEDLKAGGQSQPGQGDDDPSGGPGGSGTDTDKPSTGKPDNGNADHSKPDHGTVDKGPVDKDPVDKDPVDKDPVSENGHDRDPVDKDPQGAGGSESEPGGTGANQNDDDSSRQPKDDKGTAKSGRNDGGGKGSGGDVRAQGKPGKG